MKIVLGKKSKENSRSIIYIADSDFFIKSEVDAFEKVIKVIGELEKSNFSGKKIHELFTYSNYSLWWFMFPSLVQTIKIIIHFIERLELIIDRQKPEQIEVTDNYDKLELIKQICVKKNISLKYSKTKYFIFTLQDKLYFFLKSIRINFITKNKTKERIKIAKNLKSKIELKDKIVFLVPNSYRRRRFDSSKNCIVKEEFLIQSMLDSVYKNDEKKIICIDADYSFKGDFSVLKERLEDKIEWIPIELLMTKNNNYDDFFKNYKDTISKSFFHVNFELHGINYWKNIERDFKLLGFLPHLPTYLSIIDSLTKLFKIDAPRKILLPYETGPYALSTILSAYENNIQTIGMQHGVIFGSNPDYSHTLFHSKDQHLGMILPEKFLVFGNSTKQILLKNNNYLEKKIVVSGHPMYFNLNEATKNFNIDKLRSKFNIQNNQKIILFATGRYQSFYPGYEKQNYDEQILHKLLEIFGNDQSYHVILKPHPPQEYLGFYKKIISNSNCTNFSILDEDLFELLFISDIVVSTFSTILIDAIAFKKLPILVNFDSETPFPFNESDVSLNVNLTTLEDTIKEITCNLDLQNKLLKNGTKFIYEQYKIPNENPLSEFQELLK